MLINLIVFLLLVKSEWGNVQAQVPASAARLDEHREDLASSTSQNRWMQESGNGNVSPVQLLEHPMVSLTTHDDLSNHMPVPSLVNGIAHTPPGKSDEHEKRAAEGNLGRSMHAPVYSKSGMFPNSPAYGKGPQVILPIGGSPSALVGSQGIAGDLPAGKAATGLGTQANMAKPPARSVPRSPYVSPNLPPYFPQQPPPQNAQLAKAPKMGGELIREHPMAPIQASNELNTALHNQGGNPGRVRSSALPEIASRSSRSAQEAFPGNFASYQPSLGPAKDAQEVPSQIVSSADAGVINNSQTLAPPLPEVPNESDLVVPWSDPTGILPDGQLNVHPEVAAGQLNVHPEVAASFPGAVTNMMQRSNMLPEAPAMEPKNFSEPAPVTEEQTSAEESGNSMAETVLINSAMVAPILMAGGGATYYFLKKKETAPIELVDEAVFDIESESSIFEDREGKQMPYEVAEDISFWAEENQVPPFMDSTRQISNI